MKKHPKGIIAVIALAMFAIMGLIGIIVQTSIIETINSVKNSQVSFAATVLSDSLEEHVRMIVSKEGPGYTRAETCRYTKDKNGGIVKTLLTTGQFSDDQDLLNPPQQSENGTSILCPDLTPAMVADLNQSDDLLIKIKVKGRSLEEELVNGCKLGLSIKNCYRIPQPGQGNAGQCNSTGQSNIDSSCNWNKLTFGSNLTDRVAIPLFFPGNPKAINGSEFLLKIRTPCKPISKDDSTQLKTNKLNGSCVISERFILADGGSSSATNSKNDVVVQWQINGKCDENNCTYLPNIEFIPITSKPHPVNHSAITEFKINEKSDVLSNNQMSVKADGLKNKNLLTSIFSDLEKGYFTMLISNKLRTFSKENIPHLEYQILTAKPIGNPQIESTIIVKNDNRINTAKFSIPVKTDLIDFAIQN